MLLSLLPLLFLSRPAAGRSLAPTSPPPIVDLGYARYQGIYNETLGQNVFKGVRYAAPPTGVRRWQLPAPPERNEILVDAITDPPHCPQSRRSLNYAKSAAEEAYLAIFDGSGAEDCLFLNVFAPVASISQTRHARADLLPVLVFIHGGGYGLDSAESFDFSAQIRTNDNRYVAVVIQYRLGAFGFLAGNEIVEHGVLNAGLHDMRFALQWVQRYIRRFGGDRNRVTVAGQSAGGGAAMLLTTADMSGFTPRRGGRRLFQQALIASPWLPTQSFYNDTLPAEAFNALVEHVRCDISTESRLSSSTIFQCLQGLDTATLQNASDFVSTRARYGQWAFVPVTDGSFIPALPSQLLVTTSRPRLQSTRILTTNVANEGPYFVWQNITNEPIFRAWLASNYPLLTPDNVTALFAAYDVEPGTLDALSAPPANGTDPGFDADGVTPPYYATTESNYGRGCQQAANNLYAEATFVCPSHWLADAHARKKDGRAWRYQYSAPPAYHGSDIGAGSVFDPLLIQPGDKAGDERTGTSGAMRWALQRAWGNFIVIGDPGLEEGDVVQALGTGDDVAAAGTRRWTQWRVGGTGPATTLIANATGGVTVETTGVFDGEAVVQVTVNKPGNNTDPPLVARFSVVDGDVFEDGRAERCGFLVDMGPWLME